MIFLNYVVEPDQLMDKAMELAQQFRVMSIPTLIIFKNGAEAHRLVGLTDKEELKKLLDE